VSDRPAKEDRRRVGPTLCNTVPPSVYARRSWEAARLYVEAKARDLQRASASGHPQTPEEPVGFVTFLFGWVTNLGLVASNPALRVSNMLPPLWVTG
jgi:hypothetical protein